MPHFVADGNEHVTEFRQFRFVADWTVTWNRPIRSSIFGSVMAKS